MEAAAPHEEAAAAHEAESQAETQLEIDLAGEDGEGTQHGDDDDETEPPQQQRRAAAGGAAAAGSATAADGASAVAQCGDGRDSQPRRELAVSG